MKKMLAAALVAASTLGGLAAALPTAADAQPYNRSSYGPHRGPGHAYRRGHYGRHHRQPVRVCRQGRCFYR